MRHKWVWWTVGLVSALLVTVVLAGGAYFVNSAILWPSGEVPPANYTGTPGVQGQRLLASMRNEPKPGWRVDLKRLLPEAEDPNVAAYVGATNDRAFFTVADGAWRASRPSWLLGVDVATGAALFPPVALAGPGPTECYLNGPARAVCLQHDLYVIDTERGTVLSRTATELSPHHEDDPGRHLLQVGDYVVAVLDGEDVRGVGDDGSLTWSVPAVLGVSAVDGHDFPGDPIANVAIARDGPTSRAFSSADGSVLFESDATMQPTVGGFVAAHRDRTTFDVHDETGAKTGSYEIPAKTGAALWEPAGQLPELDVGLLGPKELVILDDRGTPMTVIQANVSGRPRIVGDHAFVSVFKHSNAEQLTPWLRFDLRTGEKTSACPGLPVGTGSYVGSDGTIVLGIVREIGAADRLVAVDSGNCEQVWELGDTSMAWAVGSTLVQARPDSGELVSLVAN